MSNPKFKQGDWVKEKTGTKGMTVVNNIGSDSDSGFTGKVRCSFKEPHGEQTERDFPEAELESL